MKIKTKFEGDQITLGELQNKHYIDGFEHNGTVYLAIHVGNPPDADGYVQAFNPTMSLVARLRITEPVQPLHIEIEASIYNE